MSKKKKVIYDDLREFLLQEQFRWIVVDDEITDYIISSFGYVISVKKDKNFYPKRLTPWLHKDHLYIALVINGKKKNFQVHRLVAMAFMPNPDKKPIVHHIDKNPINNDLSNLMWVTEKEHKFFHKDELNANRPEPKYGTDCNLSVYSEAQIHQVCKYLEENVKNTKEITSLTGVKHDTIYRILNKYQWVQISSQYDISGYNVKTPRKDMSGANSPTSKYTETQVRLVCEMLEAKKSFKDIQKATGLSRSSIEHIKYKETWTHISKEYNF